MSKGSEYENILLEGDEALIITLNRPHIHNPFDEMVIAELTDAFRAIKNDRAVRVLVITGAGSSFCAGADLNWMKKMATYPREQNLADAERLSDMLSALDALEVPTIAKVNGAAFGGGAGLVCACDFAIASDRAKLAFSEVKLGLLPGVVSPYVIERIGVKKAVQLFTSGERLNAHRALLMGLVDRIVPPEELDKEVKGLVELIMTGGPRAVLECKKLARTHGSMDRDGFKRYCIEAIADARASEEGKEGVGAFLEKREPAWRTHENR